MTDSVDENVECNGILKVLYVHRKLGGIPEKNLQSVLNIVL